MYATNLAPRPNCNGGLLFANILYGSIVKTGRNNYHCCRRSFFPRIRRVKIVRQLGRFKPQRYKRKKDAHCILRILLCIRSSVHAHSKNCNPRRRCLVGGGVVVRERGCGGLMRYSGGRCTCSRRRAMGRREGTTHDAVAAIFAVPYCIHI